MKKKSCKVTAVFLLLCIAVSFFTTPVYAQEDPLKGFDKLAENSEIALYMNSTNSDLVLLDKNTKYLWWSNPPDRNKDTIAKGTYKMNLNSHLLIKYVDEKGQRFMANDYVGSIQKNGMKIQKIQGGAKVWYSFEKEKLTIPMQYTLEKDFLRVEVVSAEIEEKGPYKLTHIAVLPYFGAGSAEDEGYLMVPDGSGALINFNNGKTGYADYNDDIYDRDNVLSKNTNEAKREKIRMPVFGIRNGRNAFLAVVTEGESLGTLNASVGGKVTAYNNVYTEFQYRAVDAVLMREREGTAKDVSMTAQWPVQSKTFSICYYPLKEGAADYSGMAKRYQQFLAEEKGLRPVVKKGNLPFYADVYGGVEKRKYIFGIPVTTVEPLTTYKQCIDIADSLKSKGVDGIVLRYMDWTQEEIYGKIPSKLHLEGKLGSSREFKEMISYMEKNGIEFYPNADFTNFSRGGNGYSIYNHAAKTVSRAPALQFLYSLSTYFKRTDVKPWYLLSPGSMEEAVTGLLKAYARLGISSVSLNTLGSQVYSDYGKKGLDRSQTQKLMENSMRRLQAGEGDLLVESANAYSLPYAAHVIGTPSTSSRFDIIDKEIPFYQMVLHGFVPYTLEPMNLSSNKEDLFLKTLETGSAPLYTWISGNSVSLKGTRLDFIYSGNYKAWLDLAVKEYQQLNEVLAKVQDKKIVQHCERAKDVYETTYENGTKVLVNYGSAEAEVDKIRVKAKGYAVIEGGKRN